MKKETAIFCIGFGVGVGATLLRTEPAHWITPASFILFGVVVLLRPWLQARRKAVREFNSKS